jgi:uncharacterized membrane protein
MPVSLAFMLVLGLLGVAVAVRGIAHAAVGLGIAQGIDPPPRPRRTAIAVSGVLLVASLATISALISSAVTITQTLTNR